MRRPQASQPRGVMIALTACTAFIAPYRPTVPVAPIRSRPPLLLSDDLAGIDCQRLLGELAFSELTAAALPDAEATMRGGAAPASLGPEQVKIGLYYGQLTKGSDAGTRILVKVYSSEANNKLAAARAAAASSEGDAQRMRERIAATLSGGSDSTSNAGGSNGDSGKARLALEASLSSDGTSLAEALAENEYASHRRVQSEGDAEQRGLSRMIGRYRPTFVRGEPALIMHGEWAARTVSALSLATPLTSPAPPPLLAAFPWRGEQVRMALPTRLPPTLAGWAQKRRRGETEGAK